MVLRRRKTKKSKAVRLNIAKNKLVPEEEALAPHSFVIHRGIVTKQLLHLTKDFRKVMEPFTASSLKVRKKNSIKDFVSVAGLLHVSHLCAFTCTEKSQYLKICRLPRGPTLTFRIHNYSLAGDVVSLQRKQLVFRKQFQHAPLVVLNGLSDEGQQLKLMSSMFQNLFPTINLTKVNLSTIRRCLLLNYDPETRMIDFRHYAIKVVPAGVSKGVKKLLQNKVPNLSKFNDISEFMTKSGMLSDSEAEDDPKSHVTLPQKLASRGSQIAEKSAIRLLELGPRMTLQLIKVEDGLMDGEVLFHDVYKKTDEEKEAIRKRREARKRLKEKRKREQEMNKKRKEKEKEEHKLKSLEGMDRKREQLMEEQKKRQPSKKIQKDKMLETDVLMRRAVLESNDVAQNSEDDDAEWYRKEVGEEPEKDLFDSNTDRKRRFSSSSGKHWKKPKLDKQYSERYKKNVPGRNKNQGKSNSKPKGKLGNSRHGGKGSYSSNKIRGNKARK
ncbi:Suppressor of SWI4 1-like protein [Frankliniella fusca]|uniref:Suppressor of SWI4 1-like protein n=1 Tax=Frankliniella fusca TaxID=407009 RepID=A0AAE1H5Y5_9NEOP|nr:Suppressor of SWI4 1-like protein [Frankliniella fusca]